MIRYVDMFRDRFGVEAICRTLAATERGFLTARGYRAAKTRPPFARAIRDDVLGAEIARLHAENYGVYGVRKMRVRRSRRVFTTGPGPAAARPADLVQRRFRADAPCRLWVSDITYVATWSGFAYVAFATDVFSRRIVGWSVSSSLRTEASPLPELEMAAWSSGDITGLIHHSDRGSNYVSLVYTDRILELDATPSVGSVGDSYDNALAEAVNGLYKTELIRRRAPWRTIEQVELATLEWVWWWNNQRLHAELDYRTPAEVEAAHYADLESPEPLPVSLGNPWEPNPGRFTWGCR